jgi:hypothetical protein
MAIVGSQDGWDAACKRFYALSPKDQVAADVLYEPVQGPLVRRAGDEDIQWDEFAYAMNSAINKVLGVDQTKVSDWADEYDEVLRAQAEMEGM